MGNIVVIGLDGNIRTLAKGESPKPGELIIEEVSDTSELVVEQVTPQGSSINVTDDITALIEAIGQGQDPTQLGEDFETAAGGVNGSSPQTTGAINRTGTEVLASTNFETVGINGTGFSSTQVQTLLDIFQPQAPAPQVTPLPAEVVVQGISSPTVNEGDQVVFDVTLDQATEAITDIEMTLGDGSAVGGSAGEEGTDYVNTTVIVTLSDGTTQEIQVNEDGTFTVSIPIGEQSFTVSLDTVDDDIYEGPETFTLTGTTADQTTPVSGTATVLDDGTGPGTDPDDDRPSVSISDAGIVDEGDIASFTVSLSNASEDAVQVQLTLNPGETEAGDLGTFEYNTGSGWVTVPVDGVVSVPAGMTEFDVRVASTQDEVYEGAEDFSVTVTGVDVVQGSDTGLATIVDDGSGPEPDPDDDRPSVSISDAGIVDEGDIATFTVSLSNASEAAVQVQLTLNPGETEAGDLGTLEYNTGSGWVSVPVDGMVTVPAGMTEFDVRVASVQDEVYEGAEDFSVTVTGVDVVQGSDTGLATIVDDGSGPEPDPDDDRPSVSISDAGIVDEGDIASFTVSLSNASEAAVQVQLTLNPGETEAGDLGTLEYNTGSGWVSVPVDGMVTVPAGMTEFDVRVASVQDEVYEGAEDFSVTVTGIGAVQGSDTGLATIVDDGSGPEPDPDDDRPSVSISDAGTIDEGSTATFTVTLSNASEDAVQVQLALNPDETEVGDLGILEYNTGSGWVEVPVGGLVTVPAGMTEFDVRIGTTSDDVYEGPEDFSVTVTGIGVVQGQDTGTATIVDDGTLIDDDRPSVSIVEDSVGVNEGTDAVYTVKLSAAADIDVTVRLNTSTDGSNTAEADDIGSFVVTLADGVTVVNANSDGTYTIPAGQTELKVTVPTTDDDVYEGDETFTVAVQGDTGVVGSDSALGIIYDGGNGPDPDPDDDRPSVSIVEDSVGVNEGTEAVYTVKLSAAADIDVTVRLNTSTDGSNTAEADDIGSFVVTLADGVTVVSANSDGTYTIPAGQTELKVTVPTTDDDVYEGDETFTVAVQGDTGVVGSDSALGIIYDGGNGPDPDPDDDRPSVSIVEDSVGVNEGTEAVYTVKLSAAADIDVTVRLNTSTDGSNTAEADDIGSFVVTLADGVTVVSANSDGTYTIPAGQTELKVTVPTTDDDVYEGDETFTVSVQGDTGVLGSDSALGIIYDGGNGPDPDPDDDRPSVSIVEDSVGVNEGTDAVYTVKLSAAADIDVTVRLNTSTDDSNTAEADDIGSFVVTLADGVTVVNANSDGTYTIPAGQTELKVTVPTTDDDVYEGDETFTVAVQGDTGVLGSDSALGIIYDGGNGPDPDPDDDRPSVSIVEDSVGVNEGTEAVYTVKLSAAADIDVTVRLNTSTDGSNTAEADDIGSFVVTLADGVTVVNANSDGTYTIPAGQTELKVTVPTTDDDVYEGDETFTVAVQGDTGVLGSDSALGIIYDGGNGPDPDPDDDRPSVSIVEDSVGVNEGTDAVYTVKLSAAADIDVTVRLNTSTDGSNTAEADDIGSFVVTLADGVTVVAANPDGTYTIPAGETELKVTVPTTDDDVYEGDETFTVAVQGDTGVVGSDSALGIIYDGGNGPGPNPDDDRPSVYIVENSVGVNEGTDAVYTVKLSAAADIDVTVRLNTSTDGSNTAEADDIGSFVVTLVDGVTVVSANSDGTYTIPAGQTDLKLFVPTTDDDVYEGDETFTVAVQGATGVLGTDTALGIIYDGGNGPDPDPDDDRPSVSIVEDSVGVNEGTDAVYTVKLSAAADIDVTVRLNTSTDGSNTAEADDIGSFVVTLVDGVTVVNANSDGTYTIPAGQTELKVTVPTTDDDVYEGDETFTVAVQGDTGVLGSDSALGIIYDGGNGPDPDPDDDRPSVSIVEDSVGVNEGTDAVYTVKLSAAADIDVTVRLNTSTDGSNTAEADDIGSFVVTLADGVTVVNANSDGTYTIPAGQTELKVTVPTTDDDVYEGDETFTVAVQGDTGVLGSDSALGIIYDGGNGPDPDPDDDRPSVSIVEDSVGVNEGTDAVYTVKLSAAADIDVTVRLNTSTDDSNTAEADDIGSFVVTLADGVTVVNANSDGTYTIPAGQTELKVTVPTTDDDVYEGDETFTVAVQGDTGVLGSDSALGIIYDGGNGPDPDPDDDRPSVSIVEDSVGVNEGTDAVYTVKLSAAADIDVTVRLNTSTDGSNTAEADDIGSFVVTLADGVTVVNANSDGTYTIPAGQTELKVTVPTTDDDVYEGDETFTVAVQGDTGVVGSDSALGIIYDGGNGPDPDPDDDRPSVSIVEDSVGVNEGTDAVYTVKLSAAADIDVTVRLNTSTDGSNTAEADDIGSFVVTLADGVTVVNANSDGTYTIPAGQTELKVTVPTTDDDVYEGDETFTVAVQGDTGVLGSDSALGIIYDGGNGPGPNPDDDRPSVYIVENSVGVNEGTDAVYTVRLSAAADIDVTVRLNTSTGGANTAEPGDIGAIKVTLLDGTVVTANSDGTYTIPAGQTDLKLFVPTTDDDVYEGDETFTVAVQGATGALGTDTALGIIYDGGNGPGPNPDDDRPSVSISDAGTVDEGATATFTVSLSNPSEGAVQVQLVLNLDETEVGDLGTLEYYTGSSWEEVPGDGIVTVPAGMTEFDVRIATIDDEVYEGPEDFSVTVNGLGAVQGTDTGLATIVDDGTKTDDDRPTVSISDAGTIDEGNFATFTVSLSNASEAAVQVQLTLNPDETVAGDLGTLEYNTGSGWVAVPVGGVVTVPAGMTEFDLRIESIDDGVYEGPEDFSVTVTGLGPVQGSDTGLATIVDNSPPTARDFIISLNVEEGMFPVQDVEFDGLTSANEQRVEDLEDDANGANDADLEIVITSLPEHGELYYLDNGVEVIIDQDFLNDPNNKLYENTDIKYRLTDDFFDEQSFDSADLLEDQGKDILVGSYTPPNSNLTFTGGQIITIGNSIIFDSDAQISVDFANQQVGLVVISPSETGQGDEISTGEYITLELDEDLSANEAKLNLASLNDRFNSGAAWLTAYIFLNGALVDVQQFYSTDITYTSNHEGFITVDMANGSFDEIRLTPETNSSSDKAGFTLVGTEITSFTDVNDDFTYQAIDTDGALSNEATVSVDFNNVTAESVATADYNTQSLTLTAAADAESNVIMGDEQDNELVGTSGNDILIGGLGDDILTGGEGDDVFKWTEMKSATDTVTDFETGDQLDFADLFEDVSQSDISLLLDDLGSGDYSGQVDDISITVTERGPNSTLMIHKGGMDLEVNFDGASAADIANSLISNLEHLRE
ncbi:hypothetical protein BA890_07875 [Vibrio natriegens NBRC 15636 = ATCC 14048 = DSM 759]|uniref:Calx-beta domain-containing protein n=7 Tax=Vibrio natriegens TaxID=691 RepID=A0AAN0Y3L3_VIBNA|nr:hypothetical protein BA890_07875 [Vibrio natriegens NBRC 15636 = ATCC 14048 = DSM 759]